MAEQEVAGDFLQSVKLKPDGSLTNGDYERVALRMAEGFAFHEAYASIGKKTGSHAQRKYRNRLQRNPIFKDRVKSLTDEKQKLETADDIFGEPIWLINQMYREALASNDTKMLEKAVGLRFEAAKQVRLYRQELGGGAQPPASVEPEEGAEEAPANPVGKPVTQNPGSNRDMSDIKRELIEKGIAAPAKKVEEEVD